MLTWATVSCKKQAVSAKLSLCQHNGSYTTGTCYYILTSSIYHYREIWPFVRTDLKNPVTKLKSVKCSAPSLKLVQWFWRRWWKNVKRPQSEWNDLVLSETPVQYWKRSLNISAASVENMMCDTYQHITVELWNKNWVKLLNLEWYRNSN